MSKKSKKILIVEDERAMAKVMELKLSKEGFNLEVVYDGEEAIKRINKEKFDLVISDLIMPKTDGFAVLEYIKRKKLKTKVVVVSNLSQEEDKKKALEMGALDFWVKSNIPISEVVRKIKDILD